jgi:hypothetical protein
MIMIKKRRWESNWKFESRGEMKFNWGVLYTVGKIFLKAIRYFPQIQKKDLI